MAIEVPKKLEGKTFPVEKIILLIAAVEHKAGSFTPDYKLMSALSEGEYTQSSLEHQFRDVRKAAQELLRGKPSVDGEQAKPASPKKRKSKTDKNVEDNAENSQPPSKRARPSKKEVDIKVEPMEGDNAV